MQATGRSVAVAVVAVGVLAITTSAHMLGLGSCRTFDGMPDFDPARFNGTWYVIRKVGTRSDCLTVNYNLMEDDQSFRVEETRRPPYSDVIPLDLAVTNAGMLSRLSGPSKFTSSWFNGILPMSGTYTLLDTDYDTFAIDYECQEFFGFIKRVSATILSRTPQLDATLTDELVDRLVSEFDITSGRLNQVDQDSCVPLDTNDFNLVIDEEGLRSALKEQEVLKRLSDLPQDEAAELVRSALREQQVLRRISDLPEDEAAELVQSGRS